MADSTADMIISLRRLLLDWQQGALTEEDFLGLLEGSIASWDRKHRVVDSMAGLATDHAREELLGRVLATLGSMRLDLILVEDVPAILDVLDQLGHDPDGAAARWHDYWAAVDIDERARRYHGHSFYVTQRD